MIKSIFGSLKNAVVTVTAFIMIICVIFFSKQAGQMELNTGDVAPQDIYAPRAIIDKVTTDALRKEARNAVEEIYVIDKEKTESSVKKLESFFETVASLRQDETLTPDIAVSQLKGKSDIKLSEDQCREILSCSNSQFAQLRTLVSVLKSVMKNGVIEKQTGIELCLEEISELNLTENQFSLTKKLLSASVEENKIYDKESTDAKREKAAQSVVELEYKKNQTIVYKGQVITHAQHAMLDELGMLKGSHPLTKSYTAGIVIYMVISILIILSYSTMRRNRRRETTPIASVAALITIIMVFYLSKYLSESFAPLLPAGLFPGIVTIFSTVQTAVMSNILLSVFCALAFEANWSYTICLIIAGTVSSYCFSTIKRRSHLLPATLVSSLFYALTFSGMSLIETGSALSSAGAFLKGFGGGFLSGLITIGALPFFEWIFNATTPMKLSELANPENKLLKRLLVEAPGTYHHSLTVANISEIAARSINADSLLARVGAYYHDIGKIRHPLYFKENQYDKNAHDNLSPKESSSIIIDHVTNGVEIAQKHHLPESICDIIAQHHGKTTTGYFLIRAKELDPDVNIADFTYPGPVPQTKEAAIVLLADSCEAAVRSIDEKSETKIEAMVRKIVTDRVNTGQFSQCNMTFAELEKVIKVITKTLGGYFHERIKYE